MRFLAISDVHSAHRALPLLPPADVLLYAGDITCHGTIEQLLEFRDWLSILPYRHKIVIAGNHDRFLGGRSDAGVAVFNGIGGCVYLENSGCEIDGVRIWGSPVNRIKGDWAFNTEIETQVNAIQKCDILLVHGPPIGILDTLSNPDPEEGPFGGTPGLLEKISDIEPNVVVFGHIHEGYGAMEQDGIRYFNVAMQTEGGVMFTPNRQLVHAPTVFDY